MQNGKKQIFNTKGTKGRHKGQKGQEDGNCLNFDLCDYDELKQNHLSTATLKIL